MFHLTTNTVADEVICLSNSCCWKNVLMNVRPSDVHKVTSASNLQKCSPNILLCYFVIDHFFQHNSVPS